MLEEHLPRQDFYCKLQSQRLLIWAIKPVLKKSPPLEYTIAPHTIHGRENLFFFLNKHTNRKFAVLHYDAFVSYATKLFQENCHYNKRFHLVSFLLVQILTGLLPAS